MKKTLLAVIGLVAGATLVQAGSFETYGPRAGAMGGAYVGMAQGAIGQYWNPAGLAQEATASKWGLQAPFWGKVELAGNILNDAKSISELAGQYAKIQDAQKTGKSLDANNMGAFFKTLATISGMNEPGKGAVVGATGGANIKIGKFALSASNRTSLGIAAYIDSVNIGLGPMSGVTSSGVSFVGANMATPSDTTNAQSATTIATALNVPGMMTTLNSALGNTIGGLTSAQFANALVNQAADVNHLTTAQIASAASMISQNAPAAIPVLQASLTGGSYANNRTNLVVRGGSFTDLAVGYGKPVFFEGLSAGANLKLIVGKVGYEKVTILASDYETKDIIKDFSKTSKTTVMPSADLGLLWKVSETYTKVPLRPKLGLVIKDINSPKFKNSDVAIAAGEPSKIKLKSQARLGAMISLTNFWHFTADMDLTKNDTFLPGYKSKMFGAGTEINVFNRKWINIPLRAGLMKNMAESGSKLSYTAGMGLNFLHIIVDAGAAISSDLVEYEPGKKLPANASVGVQVGLMF